MRTEITVFGNEDKVLIESLYELKGYDYRVWGLMPERVCKKAVHDTGDLKQCLIDTWASISQNVINKSVNQWKKCLHACETATGHHFEHRPNSNIFFFTAIISYTLFRVHHREHVTLDIISVAAI